MASVEHIAQGVTTAIEHIKKPQIAQQLGSNYVGLATAGVACKNGIDEVSALLAEKLGKPLEAISGVTQEAFDSFGEAEDAFKSVAGESGRAQDVTDAMTGYWIDLLELGGNFRPLAEKYNELEALLGQAATAAAELTGMLRAVSLNAEEVTGSQSRAAHELAAYRAWLTGVPLAE